MCKYWGKRNSELNLPVTSSLSISLGEKGAKTIIQQTNAPTDEIVLNAKSIGLESNFGKRLTQFLDLFRHDKSIHYHIDTQINIPVAAGLASSACGFAALVLALISCTDGIWKQRFIYFSAHRQRQRRTLYLARFCRMAGRQAADGMDSYGEF